MSTMNISLPEDMKGFVDSQVATRGYGTSSEYVRDLIRKEQDRQHLRSLLLAGMASGPGEPMDEAFFERLNERVHERAREAGRAARAQAAAGPAVRKRKTPRR